METVERRSLRQLRQLRFLDPAEQAGARRFLRRLLAMHGVTPASGYGNGGRPGSLGAGEKSQRISDVRSVRPLRMSPWELSQD